jgi:hypothetical protein
VTSKAEPAIRLPGSPREADRSQEVTMDEDRLTGSATNLGGKVKEGAGKLTGDSAERVQTGGVDLRRGWANSPGP